MYKNTERMEINFKMVLTGKRAGGNSLENAVNLFG